MTTRKEFLNEELLNDANGGARAHSVNPVLCATIPDITDQQLFIADVRITSCDERMTVPRLDLATAGECDSALLDYTRRSDI